MSETNEARKRRLYVNENRSPAERRARYCFLTVGMGLNRSTARAIVGRRDIRIIQTLQEIKIAEEYEGAFSDT